MPPCRAVSEDFRCNTMSHLTADASLCIYIYIYIHVYVYIYIYIHIIHICIMCSLYIYIYRERDRYIDRYVYVKHMSRARRLMEHHVTPHRRRVQVSSSQGACQVRVKEHARDRRFGSRTCVKHR